MYPDPEIKIDNSWTLFLDRDGVINRKLDNDYVKKTSEFEFLPGSIEAIKIFSTVFRKIIVVTNQRGIGRKIMTHKDLEDIHNFMLKKIRATGGHIDKIFYCPHNISEKCLCRKPEPGMGEKAKKEFKEIDFSKSIIAGDSISDLKFGKNLGMKTVYINNSTENIPEIADFKLKNLYSLAVSIKTIFF